MSFLCQKLINSFVWPEESWRWIIDADRLQAWHFSRQEELGRFEKPSDRTCKFGRPSRLASFRLLLNIFRTFRSSSIITLVPALSAWHWAGGTQGGDTEGFFALGSSTTARSKSRSTDFYHHSRHPEEELVRGAQRWGATRLNELIACVIIPRILSFHTFRLNFRLLNFCVDFEINVLC